MMGMPRTKRKKILRMPVRLPKPMVQEADRIVREHPDLFNNRQQFVEAAIREKIIQIKLIEMGVKAEAPSSGE